PEEETRVWAITAQAGRAPSIRIRDPQLPDRDARGPHADQHRRHEGQRARSAEPEAGQRWARAEAGQTPAEPEDGGADDDAAVDIVDGRQVEATADRRRRAPEHQAVAHEGDDDRTAHDEGERWVPGPCEVEEVENLGGVDHAADDEAGAEQEADQKIDEERH